MVDTRTRPSSQPVAELPQTPAEVIRKRRGALAASGILSALAEAFGMVPYVVVYLLALELFGSAATGVDQTLIWQLAAAALVAVVLKGVLKGWSLHLSHITAYNALYDLRIVLARKLGTLPLGYFSSRSTGQIKKVMHEDVEQMEEGLAHMIPDLVAGLTVPLLTLGVLFWADWRMALATVALLPLAIGMYGYVAARAGVATYNEIAGRMNGALIQYLNGMKVLKAFTRTDTSFAKLKAVIEEFHAFYEGPYSASIPALAVITTVARANLLVLVPVGVLLYLAGSLTIPTFVLFLVLGIGFNRPIYSLFFNYSTAVWQVNSASGRIAAVLAEASLPEPRQPQFPKGFGLEFEGVSFAYTDGREVLNEVSFTVPEGSVTAPVGPSGAGKSTLAKLIPRFWEVTGGAIRIGGVDVREMGSQELMAQVAFVFQDVFLFNDTVFENIRIGKPEATREEVIEAARRARVDSFVGELEEGYGTVVGENGARLSGGQRQRISIARALLKDAPIVVLDEATAFLDPENEAQIQAALAELVNSGKTVIVVAHRLSTITEVDQILVVDGGRIVAQGKHDALLSASPLYRELWDAHIAAQDWRPDAEVPGPVLTEAAPARKPVSATAPLPNPYAGLDPDAPLLRTLFKLVPNQRGLYKRGIVFKFIDNAFAAYPGLVMFLILLELFREPVNVSRVWLYVGVLVFLYLGQFVFNYLAQRDFFHVTGGMQRDMRLFLADYLRRLPLGFFSRRDTGTLDALFTTNTEFLDVRSATEQLVIVVAPALLFIAMLVLDWRLALATGLGVPLAFLVLRWASGTFARVWRAQNEARTQANSRMVEYIQGISVIRAFNLAGEQLGRFREAVDSYRRASIRTQTHVTPAIIGFSSTLELGFAALIVLGSALFISGGVSAELFLLFLFLGLAFYAPLMALGELMAIRRITQNAVRNINAFLETPTLPEPTTPRTPERYDVAFEGVTFRCDDRPVLQGVTLELPERGVTALVGPSGSGKTTITNLIARFWDADAGTVKIGGVDVRDIGTDPLQSLITMVFQDVYLFQDTLRANITMGKPGATEEEVIRASKAARYHDFITALPDGYDTLVGEGGATLSGGEKQRISIARALLKDAPIVLLDEATASIDPENERLIQQAFDALVAEKTLVVIAHRLPTVRSADQIVVLEHGRVVQRGVHDELIAQAGMYRRFWEERQRAKGWKVEGQRRATLAPGD